MPSIIPNEKKKIANVDKKFSKSSGDSQGNKSSLYTSFKQAVGLEELESIQKA